MNMREAKEKLLLYRGGIDDADPQFLEALAQAQRDPDLAEWLREQRGCYAAIRSKLRQIEPPSDFGEKVIRGRPIPFRRDWNRILQLAAAIIIAAGITMVSLKLRDQQRHRFVQGREITVKGEVLDMTCYIAQNLSGPQHTQCARECIRRGLPAGIKTNDGKVYLLTGKPGDSINAELADYAAQIVTVRGRKLPETGLRSSRSKRFKNSDGVQPQSSLIGSPIFPF
jgi:hypothetical protein